MTRLLLAEDETMLAQAICYALEQEGFEVTHVENGEQALNLLAQEQFDIAIFDINMPKMDGLELTRHIRKQFELPILMLTALDGEANLLTGFEAGADDYLTKPFSYKELIVRIKALLRRTQASKKESGVVRQSIFTCGRLCIDTNSYLAQIDNNPLPLTLTEFRILTYLVTNLGRACSGREIIAAVQGYDAEESEAREILRVHIQHIRQKMKTQQGQPEHIENVYGVGYVIRG